VGIVGKDFVMMMVDTNVYALCARGER